MVDVKLIFDKAENKLIISTEGKSVSDNLLLRFFYEDEYRVLGTTLDREAQIKLIKKLVANL